MWGYKVCAYQLQQHDAPGNNILYNSSPPIGGLLRSDTRHKLFPTSHPATTYVYVNHNIDDFCEHIRHSPIYILITE
jgi:hypothetical protein